MEEKELDNEQIHTYEEVQPEEVQQGEVHQEGVKQEEVHQEKVQREEVQVEDVQQIKVQQEEVREEEIQQEEIEQGELQQNPAQIKILGKSDVDVDSAPAEKLKVINKILAKNTELSEMSSEPDPESVLILTPIKDGARFLEQYFSLIDKLDYPRSSISIAFLVSDSVD
ncbi:Mannan polymerase II complex anp1 subunit, partial [Coemansia guatemalensis]